MSQEQKPAPTVQQEEKQFTTEQEIISAYNEKRNQQQQLMSRVSEFEHEMHDNVLVLEALKPLEPARRAHRLVGGVLIEKTVGEVRPEVEQHLAMLNEALKQVQDMLVKKEKDLEDFMIKYKIQRKSESSQDVSVAAKGGSQGVLA